MLDTRIATQRLAGNGLARAVDVVSLLACVQSQEHAHAFWSLGMRTAGLTYAEVQGEFDAGAFLRTHILRPTWHFVAAADLRWIQAVTAARVQQLNGTIYRQQGLDPRERDRALKLIVNELAGGASLTRAELGRVLAAEGLRLAYLIMNAELEGVICSGPMRGAQHTYALVSERVGQLRDRGRERAGLPVLRRSRAGQRQGLRPLVIADGDASAIRPSKAPPTGSGARSVEGSTAVVRPGRRTGTDDERPGDAAAAVRRADAQLSRDQLRTAPGSIRTSRVLIVTWAA